MPGPTGNPARQAARIRGSYIPKMRKSSRSSSKKGRA